MLRMVKVSENKRIYEIVTKNRADILCSMFLESILNKKLGTKAILVLSSKGVGIVVGTASQAITYNASFPSNRAQRLGCLPSDLALY